MIMKLKNNIINYKLRHLKTLVLYAEWITTPEKVLHPTGECSVTFKNLIT